MRKMVLGIALAAMAKPAMASFWGIAKSDMTPMFSLVLGATIAIYFGLERAVGKLGQISDLLSQINEHSRIIRQHDIPEVVQHLAAINEAIHDPSWKKYGA